MAYTKLILFLSATNASANATHTYSTTNTSFARASQEIQTVSLNNGCYDDNNNWYPLSAIFEIQAA